MTREIKGQVFYLIYQSNNKSLNYLENFVGTTTRLVTHLYKLFLRIFVFLFYEIIFYRVTGAPGENRRDEKVTSCGCISGSLVVHFYQIYFLT